MLHRMHARRVVLLVWQDVALNSLICEVLLELERGKVDYVILEQVVMQPYLCIKLARSPALVPLLGASSLLPALMLLLLVKDCEGEVLDAAALVELDTGPVE